jgi:hypothetical protein
VVSRAAVVRPIRILLLGVAPLARDLLGEVFATHADLEVVDDSATHHQPVDVVITQQSKPVPGSAWSDALFSTPQENRLAITIEGERVILFQILPQQPPLYDPEPQALVDVIRSTVAAWRAAE